MPHVSILHPYCSQTFVKAIRCIDSTLYSLGRVHLTNGISSSENWSCWSQTFSDIVLVTDKVLDPHMHIHTHSHNQGALYISFSKFNFCRNRLWMKNFILHFLLTFYTRNYFILRCTTLSYFVKLLRYTKEHSPLKHFPFSLFFSSTLAGLRSSIGMCNVLACKKCLSTMPWTRKRTISLL